MNQTLSLSSLHPFLPAPPHPVPTHPSQRGPRSDSHWNPHCMALSAAPRKNPQAPVLSHQGMIHPLGAFAKGAQQNCEPPHSPPASQTPQLLGPGQQKEVSVGR